MCDFRKEHEIKYIYHDNIVFDRTKSQMPYIGEIYCMENQGEANFAKAEAANIEGLYFIVASGSGYTVRYDNKWYYLDFNDRMMQ